MPSNLKTVFTPLKNPRTFEEVSNRIKKLIFDGVFKPGDKLPPEIEIAQQFNVGRQSIREALRILEAHLLEVQGRLQPLARKHMGK